MSGESPLAGEPLDWTGDGPRSPRFGDVYFSQVDGLAESRAVFLAGCGLPQAWAGRSRFTVGELGFGTGLNIAALAALWRGHRPPGGRLHVFSIEAFPIARADAARALAAWPELADLAAVLLAGWPAGRRGLHRIEFAKDGLILDLVVAEAAEALAGWDGAADAWFLDGFAPSRNPQMWRQAVLDLIAARSAPGARAASFTVAGPVRRGLQAAGFEIAKRPGFGRKRERLEAWTPGPAAPQADPPRVAVVGAGIAGAALARALRRLGVEPAVHEAEGPGAGASGNPAAVVTPRFDAGLGPGAQLHAQAYARAVQLYRDEVPGAVIAEGALQLEAGPRDPGRFGRLAAWDGFARGTARRLEAADVADWLGEPGPAALTLADALVIDPAPVLAAWLGDAVRPGRVCAIEPSGSGWRLRGAEGAVLGEADQVCVAAGPATAGLAGVGLRTVRGQVSWSGAPFAGRAAAWGGYVAPLRQGFLFGATHDRDDAGVEVRAQDHDRNLRALAQGRPLLAAGLEGGPLQGRASVRAASPDHMPLAGAVGGRPGLLVLTGLGGRGFTLAPLLAEQVAALACGAPRPLARALDRVVDPGRWARRG